MKRVQLLILCVLMLAVFGCSKTKSAVKPEEFSKVLADFKLNLQDKTNEVDYADKVYRIDSETYDFIYIDGKKKYDIEGLFVDQCKNVLSEIGDATHKQDIGSGNNWSKLEITTEDKYYYVSWIGDTYLYIKGNLADAEMFRSIIDKLGY